MDFVLRFSLKYKFAAVQEVIAIYRQHENQMQRKYFNEKSKQFSTWYKELIAKNMFGGKENLKVFNEWENFYSNVILIKTERSFSLFYKNNKISKQHK